MVFRKTVAASVRHPSNSASYCFFREAAFSTYQFLSSPTVPFILLLKLSPFLGDRRNSYASDVAAQFKCENGSRFISSILVVTRWN